MLRSYCGLTPKSNSLPYSLSFLSKWDGGEKQKVEVGKLVG